MTMRQLINTIDLMETSLDEPLEFEQTAPNKFDAFFEIPNEKKHHLEIMIDKASATGDGISGKNEDDPVSMMAALYLDPDENINYGYLHYTIDGKYTGFDIKGFIRPVFSTVITCTKLWLDQNSDVKYLVYSGENDEGAQNRQRAYQALTATFAKKFGFKVVSNNPDVGTYILQVRK